MEIDRLNYAFLTHLHSDHSAGLADLILSPWVLERDKPLNLFGPKGLKKMAEKISSLEKSKMTQPDDIAEICSTILKLPMQSVPFEIALNCNYEI